MTYHRHLTAGERKALTRGRDYLAQYTADQAAAAEQNRRNAMARRNTPVGDSVDRFPTTEGLWTQIEEVMEALSAAYDKTEQAKAFQTKIEQVGKLDTSRFPSLGGDSNG